MDLVRSAMPERHPGASATGSARRSCGASRRSASPGAHAMDGDLETLDLLRELEGNGDLVTRLVIAVLVTARDDRGRLGGVRAASRRGGRALARGHREVLHRRRHRLRAPAGSYEPDSEGDGLAPFWPDPAGYRRAVRVLRRRAASAASPTPPATAACARRSTPTAPRAPRPGVRHRIEHIETLQPDDLPRFAAEGVIASMQPQHMAWLEPDRSDNWSRRLGAERCDRAFPIRYAARVGRGDRARLRLAGRALRPARGARRRAAAAAARRARPRALRRPGARRRSPRSTATRREPAFVGGDEHRLGRSAPGFCADLTVFAEDPVDVRRRRPGRAAGGAHRRGRRDRVPRLSG